MQLIVDEEAVTLRAPGTQYPPGPGTGAQKNEEAVS